MGSRTFTKYAFGVMCSGVLVLAPTAVVIAGTANADCTNAGDFGAGSGCPPPGDTSGGGGGDAWPPTSIDWPPSQSSDSSEGGGSGGGASKSTPIVMPDGQTAVPKPDATADASSSAGSTGASSTSTAPTPIVPVGAPPSTAIVTPAAATS
jgi:hypothetical protein